MGDGRGDVRGPLPMVRDVQLPRRDVARPNDARREAATPGVHRVRCVGRVGLGVELAACCEDVPAGA